MQLFCSSHLVFIISYPFYQSGHARGSQLRDTGEAIRKTLLAYFPQRYPAGDTLRKTLVAYFPQRNAELTRSVTQIFSSTRREICGTLRNHSALRCGKCATEKQGKTIQNYPHRPGTQTLATDLGRHQKQYPLRLRYDTENPRSIFPAEERRVNPQRPADIFRHAKGNLRDSA